VKRRDYASRQEKPQFNAVWQQATRRFDLRKARLQNRNAFNGISANPL
jgi:hypothetical protein